MSKAAIRDEWKVENIPGGTRTTWTITLKAPTRTFTWPLIAQRVPLWRRLLRFLRRR